MGKLACIFERISYMTGDVDQDAFVTGPGVTWATSVYQFVYAARLV